MTNPDRRSPDREPSREDWKEGDFGGEDTPLAAYAMFVVLVAIYTVAIGLLLAAFGAL
jgi:hypothetical protein